MKPIVTFYRNDPNAPKTTMPAHLGANAIIVDGNKILLEKRRDSDTWGLIGGGVKKWEEPLDAIAREVREELGIRVAKEKFRKLAVYGEPGRIAAYRDGSIWRMVIVAYLLELPESTQLKISKESKQLHWFTAEQLQEISIVVTHSDIVEDWFIKGNEYPK